MKYFAEILSKFMAGQRLAALVILALSFLAVIIVPKYLTVSDCSAYEKRIQSLERSQSSLLQSNELLAKKNYDLNVAVVQLDSIFQRSLDRQKSMERTVTRLSSTRDTIVISPLMVKSITKDCENSFHDIVESVNKDN